MQVFIVCLNLYCVISVQEIVHKNSFSNRLVTEDGHTYALIDDRSLFGLYFNKITDLLTFTYYVPLLLMSKSLSHAGRFTRYKLS